MHAAAGGKQANFARAAREAVERLVADNAAAAAAEGGRVERELARGMGDGGLPTPPPPPPGRR